MRSESAVSTGPPASAPALRLVQSEEHPPGFKRGKVPLPPPLLLTCESQSDETVPVETAGHHGTSPSGCPAYGYSARQGLRKSMEDNMIHGEKIGTITYMDPHMPSHPRPAFHLGYAFHTERLAMITINLSMQIATFTSSFFVLLLYVRCQCLSMGSA